MTLQEKIAFIESRPRFKPKMDLDHLKAIYQEEDLDHHAKKIHVVGTNGKGSTSKMLTDMMKSDYHVGTFMSPYVYTFHERMLIGGNPVTDDQLSYALDYAINLYQKYPTLTFFELLTLSMFKLFKKLNVDIMVIEAGIGGRLDATNIIKYDVSILTSIGHDHLQILGPTLIDVLHEKIDVVNNSGMLISGADPLYTPYINAFIKKIHAKSRIVLDEEIQINTYNPLTFVYNHHVITLSYLGSHYAKNAVLALEAIAYLKLTLTNPLESLKVSTLYGRFEHISHDIYVDAAHNKESIEALAKTLEQTFPGKTFYIILSALGDKDIASMIATLKPFGRVYLTKFDDPRYVDISMHQREDVLYFESFEHAYAHVRMSKKENEVILCTGSIHFISQIKGKIQHTS